MARPIFQRLDFEYARILGLYRFSERYLSGITKLVFSLIPPFLVTLLLRSVVGLLFELRGGIREEGRLLPTVTRFDVD